MKDDKSSQNNSGKENEPVLENGKKKGKEEKPPTKVVVRRLPPSMTEEQFKMQVSPLPDFDYFYFVSADMTLTPNAFSRAYINFLDQNDLFIFTQKFDGYVFVDSKGGEYPAVVEFAPFQRIPKNRPNRRKDPKIGTIEADAFYIAFKERLEAENLEKKASANVSKQHFFETSLISEKKEANNTPLLDFIKNRKAERQRIRDEKREEKRKKDLERRRAKEDQKRIKKEDETSVVKTPLVSPLTEVRKIVVSSEIKQGSEDQKGKASSPTNKPKVRHPIIQKPVDSLPTNKKDKPACIQKVQDLVHFFNLKNSDPVPYPTSRYNPVPIVTRNGKMFVPQSSVFASSYPVCTRRDIILKPTRVVAYPTTHSHVKPPFNLSKQSKPFDNTNTVLNECNRGSYECNKGVSMVNKSLVVKDVRETLPVSENVNKTFPAEVFSKNLKKVLEDVLGNSQVKSSNECVIDKPKTFVKRIVEGSGDQCKSPGFNSVNFYLPPRAFGFGQTESMETPLKKEMPTKSNPNQQEKAFSTGLAQGYVIKKHQLPPFSRKNIVVSKSDGNIESNECVKKVGGSEESFRTNSNCVFDSKPRPHSVFKRPFTARKNQSISK